MDRQPGAAEPASGRRFTIDPDASEVRLLVYRDGPMARFGHNHVIVGRARGEVVVGDSSAQSGFRIELPLAWLAVDPAAARAEEGADFAAEVSDSAREGTRKNMLGPDVLDADAHPLLLVQSLALAGPRWNPEVMARVSLRGAAREIKFPAAVVLSPDAVTVVASFRVLQSELGLKPFSVMGGAVSVRDAIDLRVRLIARPAGP